MPGPDVSPQKIRKSIHQRPWVPPSETGGENSVSLCLVVFSQFPFTEMGLNGRWLSTIKIKPGLMLGLHRARAQNGRHKSYLYSKGSLSVRNLQPVFRVNLVPCLLQGHMLCVWNDDTSDTVCARVMCPEGAWSLLAHRTLHAPLGVSEMITPPQVCERRQCV